MAKFLALEHICNTSTNARALQQARKLENLLRVHYNPILINIGDKATLFSLGRVVVHGHGIACQSVLFFTFRKT